MKNKLIAPSILSADFIHLGDEVKKLEEAGITTLHLDIMDGHFVPNLTFGPPVVKQIRKFTNMVLDTHLMIENPEQWIDAYAEAGSDIITVHAEACTHLHRTLIYIKQLGKKAAVSLNPSTHPLEVEYVLQYVDMVLVMSVNPGFSGQTYIADINKKIAYFDELRKKEKYKYLIEVDGGVNKRNIQKLDLLGADVFVMGSAFFKDSNYRQTVKDIRKLI